ncbi:MAG: Na(+)/H(+) antiporter subunit D [Deltaproteobacteria bacterium]|nr:Na(+)/H(+) antiporter subunit D [Deltaproteobacteria bacterium]
MSEIWFHPSLILLLGAVLVPLLRGRARNVLLLAVPALAFFLVMSSQSGVYGVVRFLDWDLTFGRVDRLSQVFGYIMTLMCILGSLYALHVKNPLEHIAAWTYVAGSLGVIYAGDFLVLLLFWEMMAFSSVFLIWLRRDRESLGAGYRYLLVHVAGGVLLLSGVLLRYQATGGDLTFGPLDVSHPNLSTWLILAGFLLNAAVPPLHAWLPDAYSAATVTGSIFLCAFTTKTAVYALCRGFAGMEILLVLGTVMALYGVVYAVLENDARRLLAYHIISQVGYMVAGVGLGSQMAINGVCAHAFAHILYKGLLFMGTGSVLHMTGKSKFTELGGLYRKMPWTFVFTLIGGLSISAFPLFSGFVSKSMIVAAGFEQHHLWAGFLLLVASAGTFLHTGLKVPYFIWFGRNNCSSETWERAAEPPWNMGAAMTVTALLCIGIGCYTPYLYTMLPFPVEYQPYTAYHVTETLQILLFTGAGFFLFLKKLEPQPTISLDMDWFYRISGRHVARFARGPVQTADSFVGELYRRCGMAWMMVAARGSARFDRQAIDGVVDGLALAVRSLGSKLRHAQTRQVQVNIVSTVAVIVLLLLFYVLADVLAR